MFAVSACSRNQVTPTTLNLEAVKKIFKYLKGQPKLGLWYLKESPLVLEAYSDRDYAGANKDRKSTTGGCQFLGRRWISWQCKKQTIVATSSTKAEYVAAANCCGQGLGHEWYFDLDYLADTLGYKHVQANQSVGTQGAVTNSVGTQGSDSDSDYDEQVIIVPSYPSHIILRSEPKDTSGDEVDDSPLHSADEIFQKELTRLKGQAQRATSDAKSLGLSLPVPTGSIPVPTGNTVVSTDNVPVHTSTLPEGTKNFIVYYDASLKGFGAILMQREKIWHLYHHMSRGTHLVATRVWSILIGAHIGFRFLDFEGMPKLMRDVLYARIRMEHLDSDGVVLGGAKRRMSWREFILALGYIQGIRWSPPIFLDTGVRCGNIIIYGTYLNYNSATGNSFTYDIIPEAFDEVQVIPNPPSQCHFNIYLCQIYKSNSHYGFECSQRVPLVYEPELCYIQNFSENDYSHDLPSVDPLINHHCCYKCGNSLNDFFCPHYTCKFCGNGAHVGYNFPAQVPSFQTLPSFPQQYPCCEDCEDLFEANHCQTPQYTINHLIFNAHNNLLNSQNKITIAQNKLMEQLTSMCEIVVQFIRKKQEEKKIKEDQVANARYSKILTCCDDDDDYNFAITPNEPVDSLGMGDEHLDTIPATNQTNS
nr:uncharacterized mitochondrial protein AtMg00810-like [Tanacetum cinerariifolium]